MKLDQAKAIKWIIGTLLAIVLGSVQAAWWISENIAMKPDLVVVQTKQDILYGIKERALVKELAELEKKRNPTPRDLDKIKWLREKIDEIGKIRRL